MGWRLVTAQRIGTDGRVSPVSRSKAAGTSVPVNGTARITDDGPAPPLPKDAAPLSSAGSP